ncbi:SDR family oxidoreductase [Nostoc sp. FACHB-888]|uniref:SDR family oxidoreductase n=1 Tax=Nostoc sp. FACHB-888 TaxID=2692842 RepID=UPI0016873553|nr:SDR family oxidoreductase [Nostoc sp. FACHB-888]MBD2248269.1 SDR family oxidoreductase [Nostoc sp. FACHB-888]
MSTQPTILVLGATGKVGAKIAQILAQSGDVKVVAGVRSPNKIKTLEAIGIEIRHLDLDRQETLAPALAGIDRALLLTGYTVDMLKQSKAFLDTAKQTGVEHIVHIGASGAPTNEVAHWGWHQFIEKYIEALGFSFTHLRPEAFMQNLLSFGWLNKGVLTNYIANARWSWVSCDDVALVAAVTLRCHQEHRGQIYPLGYEAATMPEIAKELTEIIGKPFQVDNHSPEEFLETVLKAGGDPAYMQCIYHQLKLNIANAIPEADATFDNFEQITGQKPTTWQSLIQQERSSFIY